MSSNPAKGYYSLIQYCPDLGRLEAANIGVLLFCPDRGFLKAQTCRSNQRIMKFFGKEGHDWARVNAFKLGLEDRLRQENPSIRNLEDLNRFIAKRANLIQISPPRPMRVTDPERNLHELFEEIVNGVGKDKFSRPLQRKLTEKFSHAGLDKKIQKKIRVAIPVLERESVYPFAYQNGRLNLISPVSFRAKNSGGRIQTACKYAVEGRSLYENPDSSRGSLQLVIVGHFSSLDKTSPRKISRIFAENHVKLYEFSKIQNLISEIQNTAQEIP